MPNNEIDLTIVVNGQLVHRNKSAPLRSVIARVAVGYRLARAKVTEVDFQGASSTALGRDITI